MRLLKFITTSLLLTSVSTLVYANQYKDSPDCYKDTPPPCYASTANDGFYLGAQLGYDSYWVKQNISLPAPGDISGNPRINAPGWVGGLLVGYGKYFNDFYYLAGEVFGNYSQANESYQLDSATTSYSSKIEANGTLGVSVLPGLRITDASLAYIRLGYNWTNFKANESASGTSTSKSSTNGGFNYGLGLETLLVDNWSLRGEYTHTNNTSFSTSYGTSFDPSDNQFMVAVIYHLA